MPARVTIASPRTLCVPKANATPLSGWPSNRSRKMSDQVTLKPQLAGLSAEIFLPQRVAPVAQGARRECFDGSFQMRHRLAVPSKELRQRLAMREVQPA